MDAAAILTREFERCRPWIEATLAAENHEDTAANVLAMVLDGRSQIWPGPDAVILTQISETDDGRVLTYWFMGGALKGALSLHQLIMPRAKALGCVEVRCAPFRRAWSRIGRLLGFSELRPGIWGRAL